MKKQIISFSLIAAGFLLGATALSALASGNTWTPPSQTPPNGNVDAPINVGPNTTPQIKTDSLVIQGSKIIPTDTDTQFAFQGSDEINTWVSFNLNGIVPSNATAVLVQGQIDLRGDQNSGIAHADLFVRKNGSSSAGKSAAHASAHLIAQEGNGSNNLVYVGSSGTTLVPIDSTLTLQAKLSASGGYSSQPANLYASLFIIGYVQ
jgi:hypothetical protein